MCSNGFAASLQGPTAWRFFSPGMGLSDRSTGRVRPERYLRRLHRPCEITPGSQGPQSRKLPPTTPPELARRILGGETDGPRYGQGRDTKQNSTPSNRVPVATRSGERFAESGLLPGDNPMTLEETLARAICEAFWRTAEEPRTWATSSSLQREVWMICARDAIAAGQAYRKTKEAA